MENTILITANWHTGALSQQTISRQYDNNRYVVQFVGYPEASEGNELDYYLLVWMSSAPGETPDEIAPIQLASDQWYISNVFTQQTQQIKFQMCVLNTAGTFEAHSPIFTGFVRNSLEHDGTTRDIDVSTLFDAYREYLNELIIRSGAVVIDSTLSQSGQAADAKETGDEITGLKADLNQAIEDFAVPTQEAVDNWLDDHPEATTTVQDGAITARKLAGDAVTVETWRGNSSINNWSGNSLEEKLIDFLNNANIGAKLDLQGAKITITQRFVKDNYTFLNNTIISNGIFEIPSSIGGWLSIDSAGGYRVPIFVNCTFICNDENASGAIFYNSSYNFKAVGCHFYNVQIIAGGYIQACELIGCNIMNRISYLIECDYAVGVTMTECSFEAGNAGVFLGNGHATRASLTYGSFSNCIFEGFTQAVFRTHGITSVGFNSCYVESVPYLIYDTNEYTQIFYVYIDGGKIDNRESTNDYTIYSNISYPILVVENLHYNRTGSQYLSNFSNAKRQITSSNYGNASYLFGANGGKNEIIKNNYTFTGTNFSFSTNGTSMYSQPQAFLVVVSAYSPTPILLTRVSLLTLNYKPSVGEYEVTETPIVANKLMSAIITWTATADSVLGKVTITGQSTSAVSLSVVNLGATMSGMIV